MSEPNCGFSQDSILCHIFYSDTKSVGERYIPLSQFSFSLESYKNVDGSLCVYAKKSKYGYKISVMHKPEWTLLAEELTSNQTVYTPQTVEEITEAADKPFAVTKPKHKEYRRTVLWAGIVVATLIISTSAFVCFDRSPKTEVVTQNSPLQKAAGFNVKSLYESNPIEPPPHNDVMCASDEEPNLTIETRQQDGLMYYVKIVNVKSGLCKQTIFIHSGKVARVYVPNGTYQIKWVSGDRWYGRGKFFNNTSAQVAEEEFTFTDTQGWKLTLYPVSNGNLQTDTIDIDNF